MKTETQKKLVIGGFIIAPMCLLALFTFYPVYRMIIVSFTNWDGLGTIDSFVGLSNYKNILTNPRLFGVFKVNAYYAVGGILQIFIALYLAVVVNKNIPGKNFFRGLLFLPFVLNMVAVSYMFDFVYSSDGVLNIILTSLGFSKVSFLGNADTVNYSLAAVSVWKNFAFNMMIFLGALQSIPQNLYEVARIDGANEWQRFLYITLPSLREALELSFFFIMTGALRAFSIPFIMTDGGPMGASETYVLKVIDLAFNYDDYGTATAMSIVLLAIIGIVIFLQRKILDATVGGRD